MEIALDAGIHVREEDVTVAGISRFSEGFITNSVVEIMPLVGVGDSGRMINIGSGKPGDITRRLLDNYREMVASVSHEGG